MSMTVYVDDLAATPGEIILEVEELEEVIAPTIDLKITANHNETLVDDEVTGLKLPLRQLTGVRQPAV